MKYFFTRPVKKYFIFWREKQSAIAETYGTKSRMRVTHRFEIKNGLSPRMHQTFNNRYNPNGYGSLRVTPIACGLEVPIRHGKTRLFYPSASFYFVHP